MLFTTSVFSLTGTLTKNEMTVVAIRTSGTAVRVTGSGYSPDDGKLLVNDEPVSGGCSCICWSRMNVYCSTLFFPFDLNS